MDVQLVLTQCGILPGQIHPLERGTRKVVLGVKVCLTLFVHEHRTGLMNTPFVTHILLHVHKTTVLYSSLVDRALTFYI